MRVITLAVVFAGSLVLAPFPVAEAQQASALPDGTTT
jgi:hypothetical protein